MHLNNVGSLGLRRYSVLVACCTFGLVIAGGLVTSNDAALSVPDWPLSWGHVVPALEGGIRYEFAHRVLAMLVGVLTVGLAFAIRREVNDQSEPRPLANGLVKLSYAAVGTVMAQAALGGIAVKFVTPAWATIAHASLGQVCFALTVAICVSLYGGVESRGWYVPGVICTVALFAQTILGA